MDYHTKEFTYKLRPDDIIEISMRKDFEGNLVLEEVEENLRILDEVIGGKPKGIILHFPEKYVKKEVLKQYTEPPKHVVARAFLTQSFASKLIGNLYLTLIQRFIKENIPSKIFSKKQEAIEWLTKELNN
ncbi:MULTISPECIES: hypothetical protein [unclassified Aureispira]|uniref:DUF7793 family protein n=1 Tax=unclassified Aureispira TaxID=2649989 RepID=UPI0006963BE4|nr:MULTISPECIES: hypothetical protein [unclassified Aureispira]WMX12157.1 hypothetical protein QP953_15125 [Aureispira sp. CCB-E]